MFQICGPISLSLVSNRNPFQFACAEWMEILIKLAKFLLQPGGMMKKMLIHSSKIDLRGACSLVISLFFQA